MAPDPSAAAAPKGLALKQHGERIDYTRNRPAGVGVRFVAAVIDGTLLTIVTNVLLRLLSVAMPLSTLAPDTRFCVQIGLGFVLSVVGLAYPIHRWGKTIGKALLRLRVIDARGAASVGLAEAILREYFGKLLSTVTLIGYPMALFHEQKLTLHDRLAGTRVVHDDADA